MRQISVQTLSDQLLPSLMLGIFVGTIVLLVPLPALAAGAGSVAAWQPQILLRQALQWIDTLGAIGGAAFILLYIIATVALLPGSVLTLGAGVVFGVVWGSIYGFIGATLGATVALLVGRYLARDRVATLMAGNKLFQAIDQAVSREGFKLVVLTRLSPVFPFNILNYAFGLTTVSLRDYLLGSVGMLPATVMYVYLGSLAGDIARVGTETQPAPSALQWMMRLVGLAATVAVTLYITRIARKALQTVADTDSIAD